MTRHSCFPLALAALVATTAGARAQTTTPLHGFVHHDSTRVALATVELVAVGTRTTDSAGVFSFPSVLPGRYQLRVRRLGFEPYDERVDVQLGDTAVLDVALRQLPQQLPQMLVRGTMVKVPKGFEEIYRRGAHSFGYFITAEEIAQRNPMQTRDLLTSVPGILLEDNSIVFARCRSRGGNASANSFEGAPQVYIDGQRITRFARTMGDEVELALSYVEPRQIQAIEVYTGLSQIPGDFASQACAAIAIWTKHE